MIKGKRVVPSSIEIGRSMNAKNGVSSPRITEEEHERIKQKKKELQELKNNSIVFDKNFLNKKVR